MSTHRFTVNVPNPTDATVVALLSLESATLAGLDPPLDVPRGALKRVSASLALDPCAREGKARLRVTLEPYASVDVYATIVTADSRPGVGGAAAFNLVDRRGGRTVGGVMLVCVDRPGAEAAGTLVKTPKPCPVTLSQNPYAVPLDGHPAKQITQTVPFTGSFTLVVPVTNPRQRTLDEVTAYLEHTGASGAAFVPAVWNIGTLNPGQIFYATWTVFSGGVTGAFSASVVVESQRADPTRLIVPLRVGRARREDAVGRKGVRARRG